MKNTNALAATAAAVAATTLLAACTGSNSSTTKTSGSPSSSMSLSTAALKAHRGGTLKMIWQSAGTSIDTAVDYDPNWFILRMTADGLMAWKQVGGNAGNSLVPDLATAAPVPTDGGKTYTFTIRPGIKYSTGATVKASDFAYSMTREFKVPGPGVGLYSGIVGATGCISKPASCDLSKGVVANDAAGTVAFHLTAPDSDFLQKLALPFAYVVPSGTPNVDTGTKPLPATGPYMIKSYAPNKSLDLVRNPEFKQWSADAQPDGFPDGITMTIGIADEDAVTQVENGQADWVYDPPPADRLNELATKFANQIHINSTRSATSWR